MSKYTLAEFQVAVALQAAQNGGKFPKDMALLPTYYIELLQDIYCYVPPTLGGAVAPSFDSFVAHGVEVISLDNNGNRLNFWSDILVEYGKGYASLNPTSHLGGYMKLDIGPWSYPVRLPAQPNPPLRVSWTIRTLGVEENSAAPPLPHSSQERGYDTAEPECLCSSRSLVTVGHEQGCRWMHWKSMGGTK